MQWQAGLYDQQHAFVSHYGSSLIAYLKPQQGEKVLDLGCGTGDLAHELMLYRCEVTGLDASQEMITQARNKFPDIRFVCENVTDFSFEEHFDAVFSNAVLHWIPKAEQEQVLQQVYQHLKPGGRFVAEFGADGNVIKIRTALRQVLVAHGFQKQADIKEWYFPTVEAYKILLEKQGFVVEQIEDYDRPTALADTDNGIEEWLEMFGETYFEGIPDRQKKEIILEIQERLYKDLYKEDKWIADYRRLRFKAVRE